MCSILVTETWNHDFCCIFEKPCACLLTCINCFYSTATIAIHPLLIFIEAAASVLMIYASHVVGNFGRVSSLAELKQNHLTSNLRKDPIASFMMWAKELMPPKKDLVGRAKWNLEQKMIGLLVHPAPFLIGEQMMTVAFHALQKIVVVVALSYFHCSAISKLTG